jgi:anti-sigma factor RsiW
MNDNRVADEPNVGNSTSPPCGLDAERLGAFLDGRLNAGEVHAVEDHLADCEPCRWVAGRAALLAVEARRGV